MAFKSWRDGQVLFDKTQTFPSFQRPKHSPMESFLQPLKGSLWLSLVLAVFLVAVAIHLLDLKSPFDRFYANSEDPMFERPEMERRVTMGEVYSFEFFKKFILSHNFGQIEKENSLYIPFDSSGSIE